MATSSAWWRTLPVDDINHVLMHDGWHSIIEGTLNVDEAAGVVTFQEEFPTGVGPTQTSRIVVGPLSSLFGIAAPPKTPLER